MDQLMFAQVVYGGASLLPNEIADSGAFPRQQGTLGGWGHVDCTMDAQLWL